MSLFHFRCYLQIDVEWAGEEGWCRGRVPGYLRMVCFDVPLALFLTNRDVLLTLGVSVSDLMKWKIICLLHKLAGELS